MEQLKTLRDKTGAGISDCNQALIEANGDLDKAVEILRKKGIAKAAKRGDRQANEGVVLAAAENGKGFILEANAETDFVVRSDRFQEFAREAFEALKKSEAADRDALLMVSAGNETMGDRLGTLSGVIGEKLDIKRAQTLTAPTVAAYTHLGGSIGVLVALDKPGMEEVAREVAMQIAAADPRYIAPTDIPAETLAKEQEIYTEQLKTEGKPEAIWDKIIAGKLDKFYQDACLLEQAYIKDDKVRIKSLLAGANIAGFVRYSLK